jgi:hypothetical protein
MFANLRAAAFMTRMFFLGKVSKEEAAVEHEKSEMF